MIFIVGFKKRSEVTNKLRDEYRNTKWRYRMMSPYSHVSSRLCLVFLPAGLSHIALLSANKACVLALQFFDLSRSFLVTFGDSLELCLTITSMESKGSNTPHGCISISVAKVGCGTFSCRLVATRLRACLYQRFWYTAFRCTRYDTRCGLQLLSMPESGGLRAN
jgi:hypothetical protein